MPHEPQRQESYLRQVLGLDKKSIGLFLGAGTPMSIRVPGTEGGTDPLIPDIAEMTRKIRERLIAEDNIAFNTVLSHLTKPEQAPPTIELILSHIRSLHQVAELGAITDVTAESLIDLDRVTCEYINNVVSKELPDLNTPYHKLAAWIRATSKSHCVELFTTNYDLLLEQALEELHVPYFDGFVGSKRPFFDPYALEIDQLPNRWTRVWKLHGSINWYYDQGQVYRGYMTGTADIRRVIHPSHLKYDESRKMPYLALIDRLKSFLNITSSCIITCGYSFRDQHLNATMIQGLQGNSTAIIFALLHGKLENYPEAVQLALKCPNLSLLAEDQAIIGMKHETWAEINEGEERIQSIAIDWVEHEANKYSPKFKLGDFGTFGKLLEDVIGNNN